MIEYKQWGYTGGVQQFTVPPGITEVYFECWGASGGIASKPYAEVIGKTVGGSPTGNRYFTNDPASVDVQAGQSFSNPAGYAAGLITVTPGETYLLYVGGNGQAGYSTITKYTSGAVKYTVRAGAGGWNGGGSGGKGMKGSHNVPSNYTHPAAVGGSGGGGGGATDIRRGGDTLANRILVAGGSGGTGGVDNATGDGAWEPVRSAPDAPKPPFGTDVAFATGKNNTWATSVLSRFTGWGFGGVGGASAEVDSQVAVSGGVSSQASDGGGGTGASAWGTNPTDVSASSGGGGAVPGAVGRAGVTPGQSTYSGAPAGYTAAAAGATGVGGKGADAPAVGPSDWIMGGGGGGGGYLGGGGGGQGHYQKSGARYSKGGGGGGGSNFADTSLFTQAVLIGCAVPPKASSTAPTGANGIGGFIRASYHVKPTATFITSLTPSTIAASLPFSVGFKFTSSNTEATLDHYEIGTGLTTDTVPTSNVTQVVPSDLSQGASLTHSFLANIFTAGTTRKVFIRVVDSAKDASAWVSTTITAASASTITAPTITSPAHNSSINPVPTTVPVTWTNPATPLVLFDVSLVDQNGDVLSSSGQRAGGSRVNLAHDPGFIAGGEWGAGTASLVHNDATAPGVSTKNGKITWGVFSDGSRSVITDDAYGLAPGTAYRMLLKLASATANDTKQLRVEAVAGDGSVLASAMVDLSALAANAYAAVNLIFTPKDAGTKFRVRPTDASGVVGNSISGQITYTADFLIEPYNVGMATAFPAWFSGGFLNGLTGTVSWSGTANASPSILTNTSSTTYTLPYDDGVQFPAYVRVRTMSAAAAIIGLWSITAQNTVNIIEAAANTPIVVCTFDNPNGLVLLDLDANDASGEKTLYFDVYRTDVATGTEIRVGTGMAPDPTTRHVIFRDIPADGQSVTYRVRAWTSSFGYADQINGTVVVNS